MLGLLGAMVASGQVQPNPPTNVIINGQGDALFLDDFEYVANRLDAGAREVFIANGWHTAKTQATRSGSNGYVYTVDQIPGYYGVFPGRNSRRVLAMEALPTSLGHQTDFYLQYGNASMSAETIPGNVWFQYWIYLNYYDAPAGQQDQLSRFATRNKFIYPCLTEYPCDPANQRWHFLTGSVGCQEPDMAPVGEQFICTWEDFARISSAQPENSWKMYQTNQAHIRRNQWTLVKLHFDTSGPTGTYEAWLRPMGGQWTKIAEWIGGVTPGFTWNIPENLRTGHRVIRIPTTINAPDDGLNYDSWTYLDDFVIATSEAALPTYND